MIIHIGLDDFDSPKGGCTTYVAARLAAKLDKIKNVHFLDYPNLIRLNPNIPFKTRGNGAVALRIEAKGYEPEALFETVLNELDALTDLSHPKTDPVVAMKIGSITKNLENFYWKTLTGTVPLAYARKLAEKEHIKIHCHKKGRGLIGAIAAIGANLSMDFTYELLAYRKLTLEERKLSTRKTILFDLTYRPYTFGNLDYGSRRLLVTPHGPDPVFFGIRGDNPLVLLDYLSYLSEEESSKIELWMIFRSNQGTSMHFKRKNIASIRPYDSVCIGGYVVEKPIILQGGHILFRLKDDDGNILDCMVYRETGHLVKVAKILTPGSQIQVYGGARPPSPIHKITLNVEAIRVIKPVIEEKYVAPTCPRCHKRMKSAGRGKGYKCRKCGLVAPHVGKVKIEKVGLIEPGLYLPSPIAYRHLTKPPERSIFRQKKVIFIKPWYHIISLNES